MCVEIYYFINYFCICVNDLHEIEMPLYPCKIGNSVGCIYLFFIFKISKVLQFCSLYLCCAYAKKYL